MLCFFFQAEDGIRDGTVTGVQTCALPISSLRTAPQPGFWEDPKRSGLVSTQQPERPKSELWHKKYEKCGLSKACDAACLRAGDRRHPCDGRKSRQTPRLAAVRNSRQFVPP